MNEPANSVVDELALREGLVAALMPNNPKTGRKQTGKEGVQCPNSEFAESIQIRVGQLDILGGDALVKEGGSFVGRCDNKAVEDTGGN